MKFQKTIFLLFLMYFLTVCNIFNDKALRYVYYYNLIQIFLILFGIVMF